MDPDDALAKVRARPRSQGLGSPRGGRSRGLAHPRHGKMGSEPRRVDPPPPPLFIKRGRLHNEAVNGSALGRAEVMAFRAWRTSEETGFGAEGSGGFAGGGYVTYPTDKRLSAWQAVDLFVDPISGEGQGVLRSYAGRRTPKLSLRVVRLDFAGDGLQPGPVPSLPLARPPLPDEPLAARNDHLPALRPS